MPAMSAPPRLAATATRRGSPPNTPTWARTQARAATWSSSPQLPLTSSDPWERGKPFSCCDFVTEIYPGAVQATHVVSLAGGWGDLDFCPHRLGLGFQTQ